MSTRIRHLMIRSDGRTIRGGRMVRELIVQTIPGLNSSTVGRALQAVPGKTKLEKLQHLAEKLPHGFKLYIFREPRKTRAVRSQYLSIYKNGRK